MTESTPGSPLAEWGRLQQSFWKEWLKAAGDLHRGEGTPWDKAADYWSEWLPRPSQPAGRIFDSFVEQGRAFLHLCEAAAGSDTGDGGVWLDRWLEELERSASALPDFLNLTAGGAGPVAAWVEQAEMWLNMPGFGMGRNQQAQYQDVARARLALQQANAHYLAQLARLPSNTARRLRDKLSAGDLPGSQVTSLRQLFDLWVDAAEEVFADLAFSDAYSRAYGEWVNASLRYRKAVAAVTAPHIQSAGIATQGELEQLSRQLAEVRRELAQVKARQTTPGKPAQAARKRPARKRAAKKRTGKKAGTS